MIHSWAIEESEWPSNGSGWCLFVCFNGGLIATLVIDIVMERSLACWNDDGFPAAFSAMATFHAATLQWQCGAPVANEFDSYIGYLLAFFVCLLSGLLSNCCCCCWAPAGSAGWPTGPLSQLTLLSMSMSPVNWFHSNALEISNPEKNIKFWFEWMNL